jgi:very-short-patch-repair endonuclease
MRPHESERKYYSGLKRFPKELRKNPTPAEDFFWDAVRNRKFHKLKFRRQHLIGFYVADFYCHELKLIIELDGAIHDIRENQKADQLRDWNLTLKGCKILRFPNNRILNDLNGVLSEIWQHINTIAE